MEDNKKPDFLQNQAPKEQSDSDKKFFTSYNRKSIHKQMLSDTVRMESYRNAIYRNKDLFYGKVVLDVGCGTGILSMMAADVGAAKVIGVDCSDVINFASKIVEDNNLTNVITLIRGKLEEITLPEGFQQVDVIISEWMGYCLLYENMLPSILYARDKFLKPDGKILPDSVSLHLLAVENPKFSEVKQDHVFWNNVQGFDMHCLGAENADAVVPMPIDGSCVVSNSCLLQAIDIYTVSKEELVFDVPFHMQCKRDGKVTGLCTYFNVEFNACKPPICFSTAPEATLTHWMQSAFTFCGQDITVTNGDVLYGVFDLSYRKDDQRYINIVIDLSLESPMCKTKNRNIFINRKFTLTS